MLAHPPACRSDWTRITIFLPARNLNERKAVILCRAELKKHFKMFVVGRNTRFLENNWLSLGWNNDPVSVVFADVNLYLADPLLLSYIDIIELELKKHYKACTAPQIEIVMTAEVLYKVSSPWAKVSD
jgi:hypothetical protein